MSIIDNVLEAFNLINNFKGFENESIDFLSRYYIYFANFVFLFTATFILYRGLKAIFLKDVDGTLKEDLHSLAGLKKFALSAILASIAYKQRIILLRIAFHLFFIIPINSIVSPLQEFYTTINSSGMNSAFAVFMTKGLFMWVGLIISAMFLWGLLLFILLPITLLASIGSYFNNRSDYYKYTNIHFKEFGKLLVRTQIVLLITAITFQFLNGSHKIIDNSFLSVIMLVVMMGINILTFISVEKVIST